MRWKKWEVPWANPTSEITAASCLTALGIATVDIEVFYAGCPQGSLGLSTKTRGEYVVAGFSPRPTMRNSYIQRDQTPAKAGDYIPISHAGGSWAKQVAQRFRSLCERPRIFRLESERQRDDVALIVCRIEHDNENCR